MFPLFRLFALSSLRRWALLLAVSLGLSAILIRVFHVDPVEILALAITFGMLFWFIVNRLGIGRNLSWCLSLPLSRRSLFRTHGLLALWDGLMFGLFALAIFIFTFLLSFVTPHSDSTSFGPTARNPVHVSSPGSWLFNLLLLWVVVATLSWIFLLIVDVNSLEARRVQKADAAPVHKKVRGVLTVFLLLAAIGSLLKGLPLTRTVALMLCGFSPILAVRASGLALRFPKEIGRRWTVTCGMLCAIPALIFSFGWIHAYLGPPSGNQIYVFREMGGLLPDSARENLARDIGQELSLSDLQALTHLYLKRFCHGTRWFTTNWEPGTGHRKEFCRPSQIPLKTWLDHRGTPAGVAMVSGLLNPVALSRAEIEKILLALQRVKGTDAGHPEVPSEMLRASLRGDDLREMIRSENPVFVQYALERSALKRSPAMEDPILKSLPKLAAHERKLALLALSLIYGRDVTDVKPKDLMPARRVATEKPAHVCAGFQPRTWNDVLNADTAIVNVCLRERADLTDSRVALKLLRAGWINRSELISLRGVAERSFHLRKGR